MSPRINKSWSLINEHSRVLYCPQNLQGEKQIAQYFARVNDLTQKLQIHLECRQRWSIRARIDWANNILMNASSKMVFKVRRQSKSVE